MARRWRFLPPEGPCLISTDLHGNLEDFERLREIFESLGEGAHWVQLGDLVHGPTEDARRRHPQLFDYQDLSMQVVEGFGDLVRTGRVVVVLGNHDHSHIGGPRTRRFHPDESAFLEAQLEASQREAMRKLFREAPLAVAAPCGLLLTHGAPGDALETLGDLDSVSLDGENGPRLSRMLEELLGAYGQTSDITERLLERLSRGLGFALTVLVHGHDRDEAGWFCEGPREIVPVIFGASRHEKRCLIVDLCQRYEGVTDLRVDHEIVRLYRL